MISLDYLYFKEKIMPARGSDELFRIIKSMTPAERGYFKKSGERFGDAESKNYMNLYEAIEAMEVYDEKKLLKEDFAHQLPRKKNHLQNLVLKNLQSFHAESSIESRIENNIQQIRILHNKGLFDACQKLVNKTKTMCKSGDQFLEHAKVLKQEQQMMKITGAILNENNFSRVNKEIQAQLELESNALSYFYLQNRLFAKMHSKGFVKNKNEKDKFRDIMSHPLLKDEKRARSPYAKRIFYNIWINYYYITFDFSKSYEISKKYITLKKKEFKRSKDVAQYAAGLMNFFLCCYQDRRYSECENILKIIHSLPARNKGLETYLSGIFLNLKLDLYRVQRIKEGAAFIDRMEPEYKKLSPQLSAITHSTIIFYAFQVKYISGDLKGSLRWMKKILDGDTKESRPDIYLHALVLNLMLHYDMENSDLLPYLIKSLEHYLKKVDQQKNFEQLMIRYFKNVQHNAIDLQKVTTAGKKDLLALYEDPACKEVTQKYFDYLTWFDTKIKKQSFIELKKNNNKQKQY